MKHKLLVMAVLGGFLLFLAWLGGFLIFNRTVFAYVQPRAAGNCLRFGAEEDDCRVAEKAAAADKLAAEYAGALFKDKAAGQADFVPYRDYGVEAVYGSPRRSATDVARLAMTKEEGATGVARLAMTNEEGATGAARLAMTKEEGVPAGKKDGAAGEKEYENKKRTSGADGDVRLIALYLPQFHQFAENNRWHGRGFTEWTNVTAAKPMYAGHYQPKLPIDVGFYDLAHDDAMWRQVELAKNYGIDGFAFYYYWFAGKKLMEKPVYNYLDNPALDLPFCLHWANENWSKRWDGGNSELLIEQTFSREDFAAFARDLLPFFKDPRYIRVNRRPLFIVYRPESIGKALFKDFAAYLRRFGRENGVGEPYIIATKAFGFFDNPGDWGLDAVMEFELNNIFGLRTKEVKPIDDKAFFTVYDWGEYVRAGKMKRSYAHKTFHTVFPRWDNTARKAYSGALVFEGSTPEVYGMWLDYAVKDTRGKLAGDERLVFINAWNEWAEGAMLEPDRRYGYAYLDVTRAVKDGRFSPEPETPPAGIAVLTGGKNRIAKAVELLNRGWGERLLISGVQAGTTLSLIVSRPDVRLESGQPIDLGYKARDTVGNAREVRAWAQKHGMDELFVVTSFYHIPRSRLELEHEMPGMKMHFVAADTPDVAREWWKNKNSLLFLAAEYTKFLLVYVQYKILGL